MPDEPVEEAFITPGVIVIDPRNLPPGSTITVQITIGPAPEPPSAPEPAPPEPPKKRYLGQ